MENVLTAFFAIFLFLFSALTITSTILSSEASMWNAQQRVQTRVETKARTHLSPVSALSVKALSADPLTTFNLAYRNDGEIKLSNFAAWDVFVEYIDTGAGYHMTRLLKDDNSGMMPNSRWTVEGIYSIYLDDPVQHHATEIIERGVVNPGEVLVIHITLNPPAQTGQPIQVTLSTPNGVTATTQLTPDAAPVLAINSQLTAAGKGSTPIENTGLSATDADDAPANVVYTVTMPPRQGELSLGSTFTQLAIDNGLLLYNHTGKGPDTFVFTISDGKTVIGPSTFTITINESPVLDTNEGIKTDQQVISIDAAHLSASDSDNSPSEIIFTIKQPPMHGRLNLGTTFTQEAINNGALTYTRASAGDDSFTFTLTDGHTTSPVYVFKITQP